MKRKAALAAALCILGLIGPKVYSIGVSTAIFLPRNGAASHPVSPLSLRDIGVSFGSFLGLTSALSLYNINGMGLVDGNLSPMDLSGPGAGPFYTVLGSLAVQITVPVWRLEIEPLAGVFGYHAFSPRLNGRAIDAYLAELGGHETVDAALVPPGSWGWGYLFGGSVGMKITDQIGVSLGAQYYLGGSPLGLTGTYRADGNASDLALPQDLSNARLDFTGIEVILGVSYEQ